MKAVILAGGRGTRLRPYTTSFPKPLMPIGEYPVLEILLRQLKRHGVTNATVLTGHLAYLIEAYFGDGSALGLGLDFIHEDEPLGTAGPLRALRNGIAGDFMVMNGDLLTDVDFKALMDQHHASGADVTISTCRRPERLELGVLTIGEGGRVTGYDEKPTLELDVSMGLYAMSASVLDRIPDGHYDMPDLIRDLIADGRTVGSRRHDGFWLDIGRPDDFARANDAFAERPGDFLPEP
jgi:NDP-sugar pyrophosphorylase family protein